MAMRRKTYAKRRKTYSKRKTYTKRPSRRRAAPRAQKIVVQIVGLPAGSQVSTATLGKKSGRPVRARF